MKKKHKISLPKEDPEPEPGNKTSVLPGLICKRSGTYKYPGTVRVNALFLSQGERGKLL